MVSYRRVGGGNDDVGLRQLCPGPFTGQGQHYPRCELYRRILITKTGEDFDL